MKTNNNIPAYRFQGYTDAWELRKLGELCDIRTGKLDANAMVENGEYDFYTSGIKKYRIDVAEFEGPAITIAGNGATVGYMHLADGKFNAYQRTYVLTNFKVDRSYIFSEIAKKLPIKIQQEARTGNIPYIVLSMLTELSISLPSLPEQKAIGTFFSTLDRQITLHQRKLDTLKEQKKTYLKLLFPAKGQTKPALRFQGFEDDWEEVRLGEVLVEYNKKSEVENQFELLSSTNSRIEPRSGRVSGESNIGYKIIKKGMIVLSPQNLWLGNINYNAKFEIGIVSPSYKVFIIDGPNELFFATVLRLPQMFFEYAQASVQGASIVRRNLDLDLFSTIAVPLPSLPEQEAIGTFFQTLDQEISQVGDKLASLKEMKKTLLHRIFV